MPYKLYPAYQQNRVYTFMTGISSEFAGPYALAIIPGIRQYSVFIHRSYELTVVSGTNQFLENCATTDI